MPGCSLDAIPLSSAYVSRLLPKTLDKNPKHRLTGVVAAWMMDETLATDDVVDSSGNANTGTPANLSVVAGPFGRNAKQGDGASGKITFAAAAALNPGNESFTILAYVYHAIATNCDFFDKLGNNSYRCTVTTDNRLQFTFRDGASSYITQTAAAQVTPGVWTLFGVVVNRTTAKVAFSHDGLNYSDNANDYNPAVNLTGNIVPTAMFSSWNTRYSSGRHGPLFVFSGIVSNANQLLVAANYPDSTIEAGKIHVYSKSLKKSLDKTPLTKLKED